MLVATHDLDFAAAGARCCVLLDRGRVRGDEAAADLFKVLLYRCKHLNHLGGALGAAGRARAPWTFLVWVENELPRLNLAPAAGNFQVDVGGLKDLVHPAPFIGLMRLGGFAGSQNERGGVAQRRGQYRGIGEVVDVPGP